MHSHKGLAGPGDIPPKVLAYIDAARAMGALVLIGDPRRNYFPRDRFQQVAVHHIKSRATPISVGESP